jgi:predicted house-cleaning noncanonical NTP pyrophosphatase (MazG superfamily)
MAEEIEKFAPNRDVLRKARKSTDFLAELISGIKEEVEPAIRDAQEEKRKDKKISAISTAIGYLDVNRVRSIRLSERLGPEYPEIVRFFGPKVTEIADHIKDYLEHAISLIEAGNVEEADSVLYELTEYIIPSYYEEYDKALVQAYKYFESKLPREREKLEKAIGE